MDTLGISLVKRACIICGNLFDAEIVMNEVLTKKNCKEVEKLHGQCVGYLEEPCDECKKLLEQAFLFIGINESKSVENNPYRTGQIVGLRKDCEYVQNLGKYFLDKGYIFIDENLGKQLNIFKE